MTAGSPTALVSRRLSNSRAKGTTLRLVITGQSMVNNALILYAMLTPILIIPVAGMIGTSDVLFFPAVAIGMIVGRPKYLNLSHLLMALFLILVGCSLFKSEEFQYVVKWIRLLGITFPFFLAAFSTVSLRQIIRVFFWSGLISIVVGMVLWWFDVVLFEDEANQRIYTATGESRIRAAGIFANSGAFGALVAMWTVACGMFAISQRKPNKMVLATILLTSLVALAGSTSRASLLSMVAGIIAGAAMIAAERFRKRKAFRLSGGAVSLCLVLGLVAVGTIVLVIPQLMEQEWLNVTISRFDPTAHRSSDSFLSGRVTIWNDYLSRMDQWGMFGVGYKQGYLHFPNEPHNQFLSLAAESGIFCFLVFMIWIGNLMLRAIRKHVETPVATLMCVAVLSAFVADGVGGSPLGSWQVTPITMIILGVCVREFSSRSKRAIPSPALS